MAADSFTALPPHSLPPASQPSSASDRTPPARAQRTRGVTLVMAGGASRASPRWLSAKAPCLRPSFKGEEVALTRAFSLWPAGEGKVRVWRSRPGEAPSPRCPGPPLTAEPRDRLPTPSLGSPEAGGQAPFSELARTLHASRAQRQRGGGPAAPEPGCPGSGSAAVRRSLGGAAREHNSSDLASPP